MLGLLSVGKRKNKLVLFSSHQCVTVSQDKAHLLERRSLLKVCLSTCGSVCLFRVFACVLDDSAVAEPLLSDRLSNFFCVSANETLSVRRRALCSCISMKRS